jgi:hypothetical protein
MIGLNNSVKDENGLIWLSNYQTSPEYDLSSRIVKSKTLDGDVVFTHLGTTTKDRDITVECNLSPAQVAQVKALQLANAELVLSSWDGFFKVLINRFNVNRFGESQINFYIKEHMQ